MSINDNNIIYHGPASSAHNIMYKVVIKELELINVQPNLNPCLSFICVCTDSDAASGCTITVMQITRCTYSDYTL